MGIEQLAREFAKQAVGNQVQSVVDALRPADLSKIAQSASAPRTAPQGAGESLAAVIVGQVQAMQKALKEDEELVVICQAGGETIRILEFFLPTWQLFVLTGIDTEQRITRLVAPAETVQLVCKPMRVEPPATVTRIGFVAPKPKQP